MNAPLPLAQAFEHIPLADLCPSPTNPRRTFDAEKLQDMASSIARHGVLQPILVRPWPAGQAVPAGADRTAPRYEIITGERRFRAATLAAVESIPANVRHLDDNEVLEIQIIENLQREEVHPIEEAEGFQTLMQRTGCAAEELAAKVGRSKAYVYARLKLTALCDEAREAFREGKLTASTALLIARIPGAELQADALAAIVNNWEGPLSFRRAANVIQSRFTTRLNEAPFDLDKPDLLPDAGPCSTCPSRSGNQPELFADISGSDVCTDPGCYQRKREAWAELKRAEATAAGHKVLTGKAAEKIIPAYSFGPQAGYVRLDDRCANALPVREIPPEPTEPECVEQSTILPVLQAKNALEKTPANAEKFSRANDQRELETKARAETDYRKLLLRRVLDTRADEPLQDIDLAVIAKAFLDAAGSSVASKCAADAVGASSYSELLESLPFRPPREIKRVLLALALSDGVEVQYWNFNTREATELFEAAERAGIDAAAVKKESAKAVFPSTPKAKAKGKKKPAAE